MILLVGLGIKLVVAGCCGVFVLWVGFGLGDLLRGVCFELVWVFAGLLGGCGFWLLGLIVFGHLVT